MLRWHHCLDDMNLSKLGRWWWAEKSGLLQPMGSQSWMQLSDWKIPWDLLTQESNLHFPQQLHRQLVSLPLSHKEGWAPKIWCFLIVVLEKTLESPLESKEIKSILKEINSDYSWKEWCWSWNPNTLAISCEELTHCKKPDAGADWREKEKGAAEDEMVT